MLAAKKKQFLALFLTAQCSCCISMPVSVRAAADSSADAAQIFATAERYYQNSDQHECCLILAKGLPLVLPNKDLRLAEWENCLAGLLLYQHTSLEYARTLAKEALAIRKSLLWADHPDVVASRRVLAKLNLLLNCPEQALEQINEVFKSRAILDEYSVSNAFDVSVKTESLLALGRLAEAETACKKNIDILERGAVSNHGKWIQCYWQMADRYDLANEAEKSSLWLDKTMTHLTRDKRFSLVDRCLILNQKSIMLQRDHRKDEANKVLDSIVSTIASFEDSTRDEHELKALKNGWCALWLARHSTEKNSPELSDHWLKIAKGQFARSADGRGLAACDLQSAISLLKQNDFASAAPLLRLAIDNFSKENGDTDLCLESLGLLAIAEQHLPQEKRQALDFTALRSRLEAAVSSTQSGVPTIGTTYPPPGQTLSRWRPEKFVFASQTRGKSGDR